MESIVHIALDANHMLNPINLFFLSLSATRYDPVADKTTAIIFAVSNTLIILCQ
jgi:hypothetical protein